MEQNLEYAKDTLKSLAPYYPAITTILSVFTVHFQALRQVSLGHLGALSDASYFFDAFFELIIAIVMSLILARVFAILLVSKRAIEVFLSTFLEVGCLVILFFLVPVKSIRHRLRKKGRIEEFTFKSTRVNIEAIVSRVAACGDLHHSKLAIILAVIFFVWTYCTPTNLSGIFYMIFIFIGWSGAAISFGYLGETRTWNKARATLVISLTVIMMSYFTGLGRAHNLRNQNCLNTQVNGNSECLIMVGKSSKGIFYYTPDASGIVKFSPFEAFHRISSPTTK